MRVLLLGGTGQVGEEIRTLASQKDIDIVAPTHSEVDLQDAAAIARIVASAPWSAVINAAAYTDVDRAESEQAAAFAIRAVSV
jgi:dTDP-4-dehydrorhamnose reductase